MKHLISKIFLDTPFFYVFKGICLQGKERQSFKNMKSNHVYKIQQFFFGSGLNISSFSES